MKKNKTTFWVLGALACLALIGTLLWARSGVDSIFGGALATYLAALAKRARDKDLQALQEQNASTQKAGQEALAAAGDALQKMENLPLQSSEAGGFSTPETLTKKGNDLFSQGSF